MSTEADQCHTAAAERFESRVNTLITGGRSARDAFDLAQVQDPTGAEGYRLRGTGAETTPEPEAVVSLSVRAGETFDQLAARIARERGVALRDAVHIAGAARPDLAEAYR